MIVDVVLRTAVWAEELSCSKSGDRLSGSKAGKHSRGMDTPIILSKSCHG